MNNMESDGPYKMKDDLQLRDKNGNLIDDFVVLGNVQEILIANLAFAEGRKSAENYTELMLKHATAEVRRCTEEVVYLKQVIDELKALCVRADARMDYVKHKYKIFEGGEISAS